MACSVTEVAAVQDGIAHDVRHDGRTLLQRRPVRVRVGDGAGTTLRTHDNSNSNNNGVAATASTAAVADVYDDYNGSSVTVSLDDTTVLATASPSVIEVGESNSSNNNNEGRGVLYISIDAAGSVLDVYAHALGGRSARYRHAFVAYVTQTIHDVFGAERVVVTSDGDGVAAAQRVSDEDEDDDNNDDDDDDDEQHAEATAAGAASSSSSRSAAASMKTTSSSSSDGRGGNGTFPGHDLYIGNGFAFRLDVDVHVLQAGGGSVLTCIAYAVHAALKTLRLPAVTLHETAAGVSVEVQRTRPYAKTVDWSALPLLCTLLLSPTRHYVLDPTLLEERALPQQMHVAANAHGQVCFVRYTQLPSRYGNALQHMTSNRNAPTHAEAAVVDTHHSAATTMPLHKHSGDAMVVVADYASLHPGDWLPLVHDAVHVCQAMVAECDEALAATA